MVLDRHGLVVLAAFHDECLIRDQIVARGRGGLADGIGLALLEHDGHGVRGRCAVPLFDDRPAVENLQVRAREVRLAHDARGGLANDDIPARRVGDEHVARREVVAGDPKVIENILEVRPGFLALQHEVVGREVVRVAVGRSRLLQNVNLIVEKAGEGRDAARVGGLRASRGERAGRVVDHVEREGCVRENRGDAGLVDLLNVDHIARELHGGGGLLDDEGVTCGVGVFVKALESGGVRDLLGLAQRLALQLDGVHHLKRRFVGEDERERARGARVRDGILARGERRAADVLDNHAGSVEREVGLENV